MQADTLNDERPAIQVAQTVRALPHLLGWIEVGAEEEGVPCICRLISQSDDVVALAYQAARSSRLGVGLALAHDRVVVHEQHLPPGKPVLTLMLKTNAEAICRLAGSNAARLVVRLPLRFEVE